MINIYPANRLENLVILLDRVMQTGTHANVLGEEVILVQSKGMQHWLNLKLAESRGISMNLAFSLPMQFFWNQIRSLLGKGLVPEQSSYTREVLSWRIDAILASDDFINNPLAREATTYWLGKQSDSGRDGEDRRFQLACQLADLYEQYQIFRPDWLYQWQDGTQAVAGDDWQALIWRLLVAQEPLHPVALLKQAIDSLAHGECLLPERINLFGINTLPPLWLEFLSELGKHTQVHFFHLNPCVEYWADVKSDKAHARERFYRWLNTADLLPAKPVADTAVELTRPVDCNPLLANLGTQGKEFLYLLQEHTRIEIPVFESSDELTDISGKPASVLQKIQADILRLHDRRSTPETQVDDSIVIASAHSALREIQALHDWLLHQINSDDSLTPKDILVMCPNVENYAPYVEAVFTHGWTDLSEQVPPLPCSIADRTLKDSEPLVQAFTELLELPDSRFQVSQILGYLRLPAVQKKFGFSEDELVVLERWVNHAAIHWGLDAQHKQKILSLEQSNNNFSWQQGLNRLLLGFAQADQRILYQQQLLLPDVEGDEAVLLGRYIELLEQLQFFAKELQKSRKPEDWKQFLQQLTESLFSPVAEDSNAQQLIEQAINDLAEYTAQAHYDQTVALAVVRDFILAHFNQPEPGRQFLAGQVTFCSMVPMRSVPFRTIAILGLNDGEFPRQRQAMGFDLMAGQPPRKGDRSRRGDDRYLFLEALISCRDKLYLSYQGHDIKTNNAREPSLVLQELLDYLQQAFHWQWSDKYTVQLHKVPLQAFSKENYRGDQKSFNSQWLNLTEAGEPRNNLQPLPSEIASETPVSTLGAEQLVDFFDNPCKSFAQARLQLYFEAAQTQTPDDSEPFVSTHLDRYLFQDAVIKATLDENTDAPDMEQVVQGFRLSGTLPDTPITDQELLLWQTQASDFADTVRSLLQQQEQKHIFYKTVNLTIGRFQLEAELPYLGDNLFFWRLATPKGKDDVRLWIHHLIAQIVSENQSVTTTGIFRGKDESILRLHLDPVESAREQLENLLHHWQAGMQQPLLLHAQLGQQHCLGEIDGKPMSNSGFYSVWTGNQQKSGLLEDPYVHWFWANELPQWQGLWQERIEEVYESLYACRQQEQLT